MLDIIGINRSLAYQLLAYATSFGYNTGNIRVYCRVRPFLTNQSDGKSTVDHIGENGNIMIINPHKQGKDARKIFSFNKVFGAEATQCKFTFLKLGFSSGDFSFVMSQEIPYYS